MEILGFLNDMKCRKITEDAGPVIDKLSQLVKDSLKEEIFQDITDQETVYYAPDYDSWKEFLSYCNGSADYERILDEYYDEEQLEQLWQASHIMEELDIEQIRNRFLDRAARLKVVDILQREGAACRIDQDYRDLQKAGLKGLYNLLHEE